MHEPKNYRAIMVSSTFTDLKDHRQKVIEAILTHRFKPNVMEYGGLGSAVRADVIESSLNMVQDSAAYIGVVGRKYGQTPFHAQKNPNRLSITELEFNEALRLKRPILLFIMNERHSLIEADIELDLDNRKKLDAFRERAKRIGDGSDVERVYAVFDSLEDFAVKAANAIGGLTRHLASDGLERVESTVDQRETLLGPPLLAALPRYLGSHPFVGRVSELQTLTDWCGPADPNPMLLFEAMGGSGKSMLTWEWLTNHATAARGDWAGRFWYSFYEKGAVMAGFCRQALAYVTGKPIEEFAKLRTPELSDRLIAELEMRPWLLVLDGLERVLVAYHRHDAAQLPDDEVDVSIDQISKRDPCAAIRPEDDDLLRRLAAAACSKVLVSSRLTPLALINRSGRPVPGVRREILPGLRPTDAEAMIRLCGVFGGADDIQAYLQTNCDCHPLVVGALAGLINNYSPARGNFDQWVKDAHHGGALNLAELNLVQRRNHILLAAIDALASESRQLLQTLALLQGGADFETLKALNPHLPPEPSRDLQVLALMLLSKQDDNDRSAIAVEKYRETLAQVYGERLAAWKRDPAVRAAPAKLASTIRDLEKRGLLQYDAGGMRYDLHPVVRGVAVGRMGRDETQTLGQKVVDYFGTRPHHPSEKVETPDDIAPALQIVRVLVRMDQYEAAYGIFENHLVSALLFNLRDEAELLALVKSFFPEGFEGEPAVPNSHDQRMLLFHAATVFIETDPVQSRALFSRLIAAGLPTGDVNAELGALAWLALSEARLAEGVRLASIEVEMAEVLEGSELIFSAKFRLLQLLTEMGDHETAERLWQELDKMGRAWSRSNYRPGDAEKWRAIGLFYRGELTEAVLAQAEELAKKAHNGRTIEALHFLRGEWHLARGEPVQAAERLAENLRMSREVGREDPRSDALLALARLLGGECFGARSEAERLSKAEDKAALAVAELWHALGERERALEHALRAHRWAVADGEPYVQRYYLDRTRRLLTDLGGPLPDVPRYDPSKFAPYPWERDVRAFIDKQQANRAEEAKHHAGCDGEIDRPGE